MRKVKNVLWTGGWDSTFRMIQLFNRGIWLQPIYVIDKNRPSTTKEIETIKILTIKIEERFSESKGKILPLKLIKREDISVNLYLKIIFKIIKRRRQIAKQYYWLACLAKKHKGLEVGIHKCDYVQIINLEDLIEIKENDNHTNWALNRNKVDFFRRQIFKNLKFPLMTISKVEMKEYAEENDFIDIMNLTWFCHGSTIKPCKKCIPCNQYITYNMAYRLNM
jgi:7-cyano-7-deazaguanine synthase